MTPWLECARCRFPPDRGAPDRYADNQPTTLVLIHQSVENLSHSRRTNRPARVPCCLRPLHERLPSQATGHYWPRIVPEIRRVGPLSIPAMSRSSALTTRFGGFGLKVVCYSLVTVGLRLHPVRAVLCFLVKFL